MWRPRRNGSPSSSTTSRGRRRRPTRTSLPATASGSSSTTIPATRATTSPAPTAPEIQRGRLPRDRRRPLPSSAMERFRPYPVAVLCAVTLFIWLNRIWLNWTNPDVDLPAKLALSIPITAFVIVSFVVLIAMVRRVDRSERWFRGLGRLFAAGTVLFWVVRLPMILLHDHPAGFLIVHSVLAIVSVVAAIAAWRA